MDKKNVKVVLTGGHLAPLWAVYEVLRKRAECVVIGRKYTFEQDKTISLEYQLFEELGAQFYNLPAGRLQRKVTRNTVPSLMRTPRAFIAARALLKKEKPAVVLTFGGYIGLPVALAAKSLGIPVVLHEQTQKAGLTSRVISRFAAKICVSFPSSEKHFPPHKTILTGNPLRREIFEVQGTLPIPEDRPVLFVTGGSAGSHRINTYVEFLLPKLLRVFTVIHQTGDAHEFQDYARLSKTAQQLPMDERRHYIIRKFILPSEIGFVYKRADVLLARSGANTVSELIALQKHALLIPLRYGQKEEQLENAKYYQATGLGTYMKEEYVDLGKLYDELVSLSSHKEPRTQRAPDTSASQEITNIVLDTANYVQSK